VAGNRGRFEAAAQHLLQLDRRNAITRTLEGDGVRARVGAGEVARLCADDA
jgi:hypothetical protein